MYITYHNLRSNTFNPNCMGEGAKLSHATQQLVESAYIFTIITLL